MFPVNIGRVSVDEKASFSTVKFKQYEYLSDWASRGAVVTELRQKQFNLRQTSFLAVTRNFWDTLILRIQLNQLDTRSTFLSFLNWSMNFTDFFSEK